MGIKIKKIIFIFICVHLLFFSLLFPLTKNVKVTAEKANIYAKPDINSYVIETVEKETVLSLFQTQKLSKIWYYIHYKSEKRKSHIAGFVKVTAVERIDNIQKIPKAKKAELKIEVNSTLTPPSVKNTVISEKTKETEKEIVPFQKIMEPLVEIKSEQLASIDPSPELEAIAFQKIKKTPEKIIKAEENYLMPIHPQKEVVDAKILDWAQDEFIENKILFSATSQTVEAKAYQNIKRENAQFGKSHKESELKPISAEADNVQKISGEKKVKVMAGTTKIFLKPDIRSDIIETVEKGTILTLSQKQKSPRIWNNISFYSKKRKAIVEGYVKVTAVEKVDYVHKISEEKKDDLSTTPLPLKKSAPTQGLKDKQAEFKEQEKLLNTLSQKKEYKPSQIIKEKGKQSNTPYEEIEIRPIPVKTINKIRFRQITFGLGYGQSYGGVGGFIQINTKPGLSLHGGIGYFPASYIYSETDWVKGKILFSGGLKYYFPLRSDPLNFYLDLQFCGIGIETAYVFSGKFYDGPLFDNVQKTLWGPSLLTGFEVKMGRIGLNGALGGSYNITEVEWLDQNIFVIFDFGLLIYF